MAPFLSGFNRSAFRAVATCCVPETAAATASQWGALEAEVERALGARPPAMRRQLGVFLRLLDVAARLRYGTALSRLDQAQAGRLLGGFSRAPSLLLRRGVWGVRTLVFLGWYTQPEIVASLGYRADPAGWSARR